MASTSGFAVSPGERAMIRNEMRRQRALLPKLGSHIEVTWTMTDGTIKWYSGIVNAVYQDADNEWCTEIEYDDDGKVVIHMDNFEYRYI